MSIDISSLHLTPWRYLDATTLKTYELRLSRLRREASGTRLRSRTIGTELKLIAIRPTRCTLLLCVPPDRQYWPVSQIQLEEKTNGVTVNCDNRMNHVIADGPTIPPLAASACIPLMLPHIDIAARLRPGVRIELLEQDSSYYGLTNRMNT